MVKHPRLDRNLLQRIRWLDRIRPALIDHKRQLYAPAHSGLSYVEIPPVEKNPDFPVTVDSRRTDA